MRNGLVVMMMVLVSATASAKSVLIMGDSFSAAYGINAEQSWVTLLQQKLLTENFCVQVVNESISGETTAGGLARIDQALSTHNPDIVLLELGTNDGLRGGAYEVMQANLTEMIRRSEQAGATVLLLDTHIPLLFQHYSKRYTETFYGVYASLAQTLKTNLVPFLPAEITLDKQLMQADGLHPNEAAQPIMLDTLWPHLQTVL